jgi:hypothetical protein
MAADVPGYVNLPSYVQNSVRVSAGTNWDLSRGAVSTPIVVLVEAPLPLQVELASVLQEGPKLTSYRLADNVPPSEPVSTAMFGRNETAPRINLDNSGVVLSKLEKYLVVGHAGTEEKQPELTARKRANAIASNMKKQGLKVAAVKSFGARRPIDDGSSSPNQRVEIFIFSNAKN